MRSAKEAVAYMRKLHELVRYLDICDGNMQEGVRSVVMPMYRYVQKAKSIRHASRN